MKDTKPFNLEHAKAGAPYACRDGDAATVMKWDGRGSQPIVGFYGETDLATTWHTNGRFYITGRDESAHDLVMTPLGYIDGKPVFVGDELLNAFGVATTAWPGIDFGRGHGWSWPAPAKQYPVSMLSDGEMAAAMIGMHPAMNITVGWRAIADRALRHAIDNGQVITMKEHTDKLEDVGRKVAVITSPDLSTFAQAPRWQEPINGFGIISGQKEVVQAVKAAAEGRTARDMAIAEAVRDACYEAVATNVSTYAGSFIRGVHLVSIIEKVGK